MDIILLGPKPLICDVRQSGSSPAGYMSRLADNIEAVQLGTAAELLQHASDTLDDQDAGPEDLRRLAKGLTRALRDVLRVAASRGHLLAVSDPQRP
ncbi:hypothetical protein ABT288_20005 [Streptomyces sp. NPDC001093]|uniref:hypothetical protein n=1 Tax=Streptomyces sp. NPDC001093 TaxID=3154376 RepID=UPI00332923FD